eukprot:365122-Chlamydomonas_euryale.AAC.24
MASAALTAPPLCRMPVSSQGPTWRLGQPTCPPPLVGDVNRGAPYCNMHISSTAKAGEGRVGTQPPTSNGSSFSTAAPIFCAARLLISAGAMPSYMLASASKKFLPVTIMKIIMDRLRVSSACSSVRLAFKGGWGWQGNAGGSKAGGAVQVRKEHPCHRLVSLYIPHAR